VLYPQERTSFVTVTPGLEDVLSGLVLVLSCLPFAATVYLII